MKLMLPDGKGTNTMLSVSDILKIGIGPSSSQRVGPMKIARLVLERAKARRDLDNIQRLKIDLHGSLALTGGGVIVIGAKGMADKNLFSIHIWGRM